MTGYDARKDPQHIAGVYLNPGTGPVDGTTAEHAEANMQAFVQECGADYYDVVGGENEGRYSFEVGAGERVFEVEMPGLPLDEVRYVGTEDQNIGAFVLLAAVALLTMRAGR